MTIVSTQYERLEHACADLEGPFAVIDLDAFDANAADLARRGGGKPIRVASKSVRVRSLVRRVLDWSPIFQGNLSLTLPEALWLEKQGFDDIVVGYPSTDRNALSSLVESHSRVTVMVDSVEHLDRLESVGAAADRRVRVCLELDAGLWLLGGRIRLGPRRSPLHESADVVALAKEVLRRPGFELVGLMGYEGQIAGVGNHVAGRPFTSAVVRLMQRVSARELAERRADTVYRVRALAPLEFVNAGGTGSLESSAAEPAVTELTAGSGLYGPRLFDSYATFRPIPAAFYALPVVRKPGRGVVTALGGGYVASGPIGLDRLPQPEYPAGLRLDSREGAGEAQTPLLGAAADHLRIGDRVWMRHAKAGELCERFDWLYLISGDEVVDHVPTYRGEGHCFL
ncbi:amino acid deaminase/aldolase [Nocardia sp. CA-120079]|uniref:amino acid deaminase/aldolase n=1 Tax=Nocardia sp. CA-120079 TaxID=3239974 RepID=UPI003D968E05